MTMCSHYTTTAPGVWVNAVRCRNEATVYLIQPDGKPNPGGAYCEAHGTAIITEYGEKLRQCWTLTPCDQYGRPERVKA